MKNTQIYIKENQDRFLAELLDLLRIPSISADPKFKKEVSVTAESVAAHLKQAGVPKVTVFQTDGHPIVYGEYLHDKKLPIILVYGHYDVQPPDPLNLWESPPFEPVIKKTKAHPMGAIFARGSSDDKGQMFMHIKAFEAMVKSKELPCNVKFMIEGEEEVGSVHLGKFCKDNKKMLECDMILVSDTSILDNKTPSITTGLRGLSYLEVEVTGPDRDLHSGVYGGAVANPVNILCDMISSLHDKKRRITIPGFYDDVEEVKRDERKEMNKAPYDEKLYKKQLSVKDLVGEKGFTTLERTSIRPALDVNGIWGGYIGEGAKTVLPSKASAKISMRLVPNQDPVKITKLFKKYFEHIAPASVKVKVTPHHGGQPAVTPTDSMEYKAAEWAMNQTFGKAPIPLRSGGSIPIVALFEEVLKAKTVLLGFGLNSDAIHSPNEHFGLFNFYKGVETIPYFYHRYAELKKS
ncbi:MAG: dipeptidase [Saprospiraceae bacterium]|nr:dipeptidase [Saprospiraceae bacterium]